MDLKNIQYQGLQADAVWILMLINFEIVNILVCLVKRLNTKALLQLVRLERWPYS